MLFRELQFEIDALRLGESDSKDILNHSDTFLYENDELRHFTDL